MAVSEFSNIRKKICAYIMDNQSLTFMVTTYIYLTSWYWTFIWQVWGGLGSVRWAWLYRRPVEWQRRTAAHKPSLSLPQGALVRRWWWHNRRQRKESHDQLRNVCRFLTQRWDTRYYFISIEISIIFIEFSKTTSLILFISCTAIWSSYCDIRCKFILIPAILYIF